MNKLQNALFSSAVDYLTYYIKNEKTYVIEPLTCMIRLAMLAFKPKGTKICVYENSIYIQEPSILQGPIRWVSGDNRNDIHYLLEPINKALQKYEAQTNENLQNIYKLAIRGLIRLKNSYTKAPNGNSSLTSHSIDLYINKISTSLTKEYNETVDQLQEDESTDRTYESLIMLWSDDQIIIINNLFSECEKHPKEINNYLYAIDNIINSKIKASKEILVKNLNNII